ncbi:MAG: flagellar hook-length control protein FliK, partial [Pseudomonadota bacterium]
GRLNGTTPFASDATTSTTTPAAQLGKPPMDARLTQGDATPQTQTPQQSQNPAQPQATTITPTGDDMPQPTPPLTRDLDQRRIVASGDLEDARRVAAQDRTNDLPRDVLPARTSPHLIAPTLPNAATPALLMDPAFAAQTGLNHDADAASLEAMSDTAAREARSTAPLGTLGTPSTVAPSQMTPAQAQQVTRQIAFAIQNNPGSKVEIMLNPAELGHVRISLSSAEAGMIVSIQADRPETLELMRRHADLLASDFRDIGYDSTSFSFEGSGGQKAASDEGDHQNRRDDRPDSAGRSVAIDQTNATPPPAALRVGDGAIDIRL